MRCLRLDWLHVKDLDELKKLGNFKEVRAEIKKFGGKTIHVSGRSWKELLVSIEDFQKAIDIDTPNLFKNTTDRKLVGYYNLTCPLQTIKDKHGNLTCERTPAKATFSKHHSVLECNNLLKQYLEERHPDLSKKTDNGFETFEFEGREFNSTNNDLKED